MKQLRAYQLDAIERVADAMRGGAKRVVLVMPTGAGKTLTCANVARRANDRGRRGLWLAHRSELVDQAASTLEGEGLDIGVIAASSDRALNLDAPTQVASVQTLLARGVRPEADLIIADEGHHYGDTAEEWSQLIRDYPNARVIGPTATPERGDGSGLAPLYDAIVVGATVRELIALNRTDPAQGLVECGVVRPGRMLKPGEIAQDPLEAWREHAEGRQTIAFCRSVEKANELAAAFNAAGIAARAVSNRTSDSDRRFALDAFRTGLLRVLVNVYVLTEGTDLPMAECCLLARSCGTEGMLLQIVGRVLRPSPSTGKTDALLIDLTGVTHLHGMPEDERLYSLEGRAICRAEQAYCPVCSQPIERGEPCANCKWKPEAGDARTNAPEFVTMDPLVRYARKIAESPQQRFETLVRWIRAAMLKGHKVTSVMHKWHAVYGKQLSPNAVRAAMKLVPPEEIDAWKTRIEERKRGGMKRVA